MTEAITPFKAFLLGASVLAIGAKFWVFTLGAIGAIGAANLGQPSATFAYVAFIVLAESVHLCPVGVATLAPDRSEAVLSSTSLWLIRRNRVIVAVLGLLFGSWILIKALDGFGVI